LALLGIDIGTTGTKVIAFDGEGKILARAYREYELKTPREGWNELDADEVWSLAEDAIREVGSRVTGIQALGISAQGEAFVPVDGDGKTLGPSIVTFDNRARGQAEELIGKFGHAEIMHRTGMPPSHICTLPKILWWKQSKPDIFKKAAKFLCFQDFAFLRMGLDPAIDLSLAARTMALDIHTGQWDAELTAAAGIDASRLARPLPSGAVVGKLDGKTANRLGLEPGVLAVTGGHDQTAGAFGCGIARPGEAMYATGTVECIAAVFDQIVTNDTMRSNNLCCYPHVVEGAWASIGFNFTGGSLLRWYRDAFCRLEKASAALDNHDTYDVMLAEMPKEPTGVLVLPHFTSTGTPHMDPEPISAIVGLTLASGKGHMTKAILEGTTYEMKLNLELMKEAGIQISRLRAVGGGAKSDKWLQIKADIMGLPIVRMEVTEAACLGVALLAGMAAGVYKNVGEAVGITSRTGLVFEPDEKRSAQYADLLAGYRELYDALKPVKEALSGRTQ